MAAIGTAGAIGAIGSGVFGLNEHSHGEIATYIALALVGGGAWWWHWRQARARLDEAERRSLPRRLYLYLAVLGGVIGLLVFGSAALYRILNAALGLELTRETVHDLWHFAVDSAVSAAVAWWNFRALRADRATTRSDVVELNADLLQTGAEANRQLASVRFSGMARAAPGAVPVGFSEVWNLAKPAGGASGWMLTGIRPMH